MNILLNRERSDQLFGRFCYVVSALYDLLGKKCHVNSVARQHSALAFHLQSRSTSLHELKRNTHAINNWILKPIKTQLTS